MCYDVSRKLRFPFLVLNEMVLEFGSLKRPVPGKGSAYERVNQHTNEEWPKRSTSEDCLMQSATLS